MAKKKDRVPVKVSPVTGDQAVDPLLAQLVVQVADISKRLTFLRQLVDIKIEEVEDLYKNALLLGRKNAARLLEMSESQLDRQIRAGKLENIYINRRTRVSLNDLEKFVEARRKSGRPRRTTSPHKTSKALVPNTPNKNGLRKKTEKIKPNQRAKRVKVAAPHGLK